MTWFDHISSVINGAPKRPMSPMEAEIYLRETYETDYGLHDHGNDDQYSLSIVLKHKNEDLCVRGDPLKTRIESYLATGIKELTGINFIDWIQMTRATQNTILEACAEYKSAEVAKQQKDVDELEKLTKTM